jgi:DNA end-binding protein Ku
MMELARHIVETKKGHFKPQEFEDHYEHAVRDLIEKKAKGIKIEAPKFEPTGKVINLMDALRRSVQAETKGGARTTAAGATGKKSRKKIEGQKEMLLPIAGKKAGREATREEHHAPRKPARAHGRQRKAG